MSKIKLVQGEALETMDKMIKAGIKVDCIIADIPYGTTQCSWDSVIPFPDMWERLNKLIKPNGAIVLFGAEPFSSALRMSNIKNYKYDWVWIKNRATGVLNAKRQPLRNIENIHIFNIKKYIPQGLKEVNQPSRNSKKDYDNYGKGTSKQYIQQYTNYPKQTIYFDSVQRTKHSTQKPVELMEYLIKTYTNENELVLDFTMGSGTTGVSCKNTNRDFIGIELDKNYYDIACNRINKKEENQK